MIDYYQKYKKNLLGLLKVKGVYNRTERPHFPVLTTEEIPLVFYREHIDFMQEVPTELRDEVLLRVMLVWLKETYDQALCDAAMGVFPIEDFIAGVTYDMEEMMEPDIWWNDPSNHLVSPKIFYSNRLTDLQGWFKLKRPRTVHGKRIAALVDSLKTAERYSVYEYDVNADSNILVCLQTPPDPRMVSVERYLVTE